MKPRLFTTWSIPNQLILHGLNEWGRRETIWRSGCSLPWHRAMAKRRTEVYERISRISQHEHHRDTPLGWIGSSGVGRHIAARPGGRLERTEPGQERRAIDTSHREASQ